MYLCMYLCIYVCIYVSMYLCMYISMYLCMYLCIYVCIYVSMYLCMCISMYLCMYLCIYVCIYVSMYLCMYISMYLCMYLCIYVRTYVRAWVRTYVGRCTCIWEPLTHISLFIIAVPHAVPPAPWALPPRTLASQPAGVHGATANPHVEGLALVQGMSVQHLTITIAMDSNWTTERTGPTLNVFGLIFFGSVRSAANSTSCSKAQFPVLLSLWIFSVLAALSDTPSYALEEVMVKIDELWTIVIEIHWQHYLLSTIY